eukprot:CAMPEP_0117539398 /NCGR_PEP_ID=MMETSP0784-20121206/42964_1 /TAXON_ID=39447 /ORGANISM="" /LENGTH=109 /DNA_ID=CAMNT_0005336023 /DNA_START=29 /DNA_END=359 /DNA_ORIENTATION=+
MPAKRKTPGNAFKFPQQENELQLCLYRAMLVADWMTESTESLSVSESSTPETKWARECRSHTCAEAESSAAPEEPPDQECCGGLCTVLSLACNGFVALKPEDMLTTLCA